MTVKTWTFILVAASFALYIGIALWTRATSTKEFYVAGAGVSPLANGMATAADWMSAASFISMAGLISFMGYDGSVYLMGWTGGYVLLALLLAPYLRKYGAFTVPDFVGDRYYSQTARIVAVVIQHADVDEVIKTQLAFREIAHLHDLVRVGEIKREFPTKLHGLGDEFTKLIFNLLGKIRGGGHGNQETDLVA